jgi:hypothetical protein
MLGHFSDSLTSTRERAGGECARRPLNGASGHYVARSRGKHSVGSRAAPRSQRLQCSRVRPRDQSPSPCRTQPAANRPRRSPTLLSVDHEVRPQIDRTTSRTGHEPLRWTMWLVLFLHLVCAAEAGHYTKQWSVHLEGGDSAAEQIADKHGFVNRGKVSTFENNIQVLWLY